MSIKRTWTDIYAWNEEHGATYNLENRAPPAEPEQLEQLAEQLGRELPKQLVESLKVLNGGPNLLSYDMLDCDGIARWYEVMDGWRADGVAWDETWIPFAADSGGNLLCIDSKNAVHFVEPRTVEAGKAARTFKVWLNHYLAQLEAGDLVVDEEGFVDEPIVQSAVSGGEELASLPRELDDSVIAALEADDAVELITLLEGAGMGFDVAVRYDEPIIAMAAEKQAEACMMALLDNGADVDAGVSTGKRTALFWACWGMNARVDLVEMLLSYGADPNALTGFDGTPLHSAVMWDHADMIRKLVESGARFDVEDCSGRTPLQAAEPAIAAVLRELGAE